MARSVGSVVEIPNSGNTARCVSTAMAKPTATFASASMRDIVRLWAARMSRRCLRAGDLGEAAPIAIERRVLPRELLPALHDHIAEARVELKEPCLAPELFRRISVVPEPAKVSRITSRDFEEL